jgi:hypothetical protein
LFVVNVFLDNNLFLRHGMLTHGHFNFTCPSIRQDGTTPHFLTNERFKKAVVVVIGHYNKPTPRFVCGGALKSFLKLQKQNL